VGSWCLPTRLTGDLVQLRLRQGQWKITLQRQCQAWPCLWPRILDFQLLRSAWPTLTRRSSCPAYTDCPPTGWARSPATDSAAGKEHNRTYIAATKGPGSAWRILAVLENIFCPTSNLGNTLAPEKLLDLVSYSNLYSNHLSSNSSKNFRSTFTKLFHKSTSKRQGLVVIAKVTATVSFSKSS
jgi:hypothetical protein